MKLILSILCSICIIAVQGQAVRQPIAARYAGLGAYSKNFADVYSFTQNQAALANVKNAAAGVYAERRFLVEELNLYSAVLALPTRSGNFGVQADYFGFKNYNESQIGLAYARNLGSKVDIGVKFNYYSVKIPSYGSASNINFEAGALLHLTDKLHAGFHIFNPTGGKLGKNENEEKLAAAYKVGFGYEASDKFFISSEVVKQEYQPVNVNVGFQYNFLKQFLLRAGIATATSNSFVGVGLTVKQFRLDVAASYHPQLGFTPGILLLFDFGKQKAEAITE
ncbi:MAG: hypothetical protein HYX40_01880 [Sphingobacteriales bacterium]|nr:hypothetical protein [Sphingobacteriales bacterium]